MPAKAQEPLTDAVGPPGMVSKSWQKDALSRHSRTPSTSTGSSVGRNHPKSLSKHSCVESLVDSLSDQVQFSKLVKGSQDARMAQFDIKRKKLQVQLELEQIRVCKQERKLDLEWAHEQHAADERTLLLKQQMQDKELAHKEKELTHKERMMQHQIELTRLNAGQAPPAVGANRAPVGFGQDFSSDPFIFSAGMTSSLPPLPSTPWDSGASVSLS